MGKILKFPSLDQYLAGLSSGGTIKMDNGNHIIKHYEVEKLAREFGVLTNIELVNCDLSKSCAVVKATAQYQGEKVETLGEVSPLNNTFAYPISVAEKRAADRANRPSRRFNACLPCFVSTFLSESIVFISC